MNNAAASCVIEILLKPRFPSRSLAIIAVSVAGVLSSSSMSASAASVEFVGQNFGSGTDLFPFDVTGVNAEALLGTYSSTGGTTPGGGTVVSGGIDSTLALYEAGGLSATSTDLSGATNRDSEIRTAGYSGGRTGATIRPALAPDSYQLRLSQVALNSGSWSTSITSSSGTVTVRNPTLNAGQTIDSVLVTGGGLLSLNGGTFAVGLSTNVESLSTVTLDNKTNYASDFRLTGSGTVRQNNANVTSTNVLIGNLANSVARYYIADAGATLTTANIFLGNASSSDAELNQSAGMVTATTITLGTATQSTEKSAYRLSGGSLQVQSLTSDGTAANVFDMLGGTLRLPTPAATNLLIGSTLLFSSGTLEFTTAATSLDLRRLFGSGATLTTGQRLDVNGSTSWNTPVTLNGGTFAADQISATVPLNWNTGTLEFTSATGATFGTAASLGSYITLSNGKTITGSTSTQATIAASTTMLIQSGGLLNFGYVNNLGDLVLGGSGAQVTTLQLANSGTVSGSGLVKGALFNNAAGTIPLASADALRVEGTIDNSGEIRLTGGSLTSTSTLTNAVGGKITGRGTLSANAFNNLGVTTFSAGVSDLDAPVSNGAGSKVIVTGGATLTVYGATTNLAGSEFRVSQGASVAFLGNVTGLSAFTGTGTKYFEGGTTGGSLMAGGASVVESSGSLIVAGIRESSLIVRGSAKLAAGSPTSTLNTLGFEGGTLDVSDGKLILDYAGTSPASTIRAAIINGSLFSAASLATNRAIGYAEASAIGITSFGGLPTDSTSIVIRQTLRGDSNLDGIVNFNDLVILAQNYAGAGKVWSQGDSNYDGVTNFNDLVSLAQNYNGIASIGGIVSNDPNFAADWALARSLVPEPSLIIGALAVAAPFRRRR